MLAHLRYSLMERNGTTTFYEAYTHVPKCAPGRMSVMTGVSAQRSAQRTDCMTKYQALLDGPTVYHPDPGHDPVL